MAHPLQLDCPPAHSRSQISSFYLKVGILCPLGGQRTDVSSFFAFCGHVTGCRMTPELFFFRIFWPLWPIIFSYYALEDMSHASRAVLMTISSNIFMLLVHYYSLVQYVTQIQTCNPGFQHNTFKCILHQVRVRPQLQPPDFNTLTLKLADTPSQVK